MTTVILVRPPDISETDPRIGTPERTLLLVETFILHNSMHFLLTIAMRTMHGRVGRDLP